MKNCPGAPDQFHPDKHMNRNRTDTPEEGTLVIVEAGEANQAGSDVVIARADAIQFGHRTSRAFHSSPVQQLYGSTAVHFKSLKEANKIGTLTPAATPSEWLCPFDTQP